MFDKSLAFWLIQSLNSLSFGGLLFLLSAGFSLIFGLAKCSLPQAHMCGHERLKT